MPLGFSRRLKATGETIAFYNPGRSRAAPCFTGTSLRRTRPCRTSRGQRPFAASRSPGIAEAREKVDTVLAFAVENRATLLKAAHETDYGGYSGYFADPDGHPLGGRGRTRH